MKKNKKDNRIDLKENNKSFVTVAFVIQISLIILFIYLFGWTFREYIPETGICKNCSPMALRILLNYPFHYFGGFFCFYITVKVLFKYVLKSKEMDKNNHEIF